MSLTDTLKNPLVALMNTLNVQGRAGGGRPGYRVS